MTFWLYHSKWFFAHFSFWTLSGHKTASWGRIWMGLKGWETETECTINGIDIIIKGEVVKEIAYPKRKFLD